MNRQSNATAGTAYVATRIVGTAMVQMFSYSSQRQNLSWVNWIVSGVALTSVSLSLLANGKAEAVSFTFEKIVDTNTPIPGSTGNFESFSAPSLDNGDVAFWGSGEGSGGIYTSIGGKVSVAADKNTPIPSGARNFEAFTNPSLDNGHVAFAGGADFNPFGWPTQAGIYTNIGNKLNIVADTNTPIPGSTGNFYSFDYSPSLDNGNVGFQGLDSAYNRGVYTNLGGTLNVVADRNTPVPGNTGNFNPYNFRGVSLDNGIVAFTGLLQDDDRIGPSDEGTYTSTDGTLNVVADKKTPVPNSTGNFRELSVPSLDNGNVAFVGFGGTNEYGIYANIDGELNVVADTNTPIPNSTGNFQIFGNYSLDSENIAFDGGDGSWSYNPETGDVDQLQGIYTNTGGTLAEVIAAGDFLDGKRVIDTRDLGDPDFVPETFTFGSEGLSGNQIAFKAVFEDDSQGIYIATVPESSSVLGTLAFSAFGAGWLLKRRQKQQRASHTKGLNS